MLSGVLDKAVPVTAGDVVEAEFDRFGTVLFPSVIRRVDQEMQPVDIA